ncbi:MAG: gliding motility-associated C-terminal domain-containing protein, partial [Vicingaceae bacterium]
GAGQNKMALPANDTMYVVTGTGLFNCISTDTIRVTINALPIVISSIDTSICLADSVNLSATGATIYTWDNGLGIGQNQTASTLIDTMFIVLGEDGNACVGIDTVNVTVNALPVVISSVDTSVCEGGTVNLSATGATIYTWDNGLGIGQNQTVNPIIDTMYIVIGEDALGCSDVDTVNVTINPLPSVIASVDTTICLGDSVNISATSTVGVYNLDNALGAGQQHQVGPIIQTTYIVSVTDLIGCSDEDSVVVGVNSLPSVIASIDTTICIGDSVLISATSTQMSYSWDNGLGTGQQHTVSPPLLTNYIVSVSDLNNCIGSDTVNIDVLTLPILVTNLDTNLCSGDSLILFVTGADTYLWDNGLGAGDIHAILTPMDTVYRVQGTDLNGCINNDSVAVTINPLPSVIASVDTTICLGDSVNISATSTVGVYNLDNALGAGQQHQVGPIIQTTYIVSVTDLIGCSDEDSVVVGVNSLPSVIASIDTTICIGDSVLISATSTQMSYSWDNGLGTGQQHTVSPPLLTNYIVSVSDLNNCIGSDTVNIDVLTLPILVTNLDTNLCTVNSLTLFVSGADTYLWDNGLGAGDIHVLLTPMDTIYRVEGTDINGCVNNDSVVVTVAALNVVASNDTSICLGSFVTISASGATSYTWNNGLGFGSNQEVSPSESTTYIVTGDDNGCLGSDSVIISIENICFEIPNVFTPNGDGKNDVWNIGGLQLYPEIVVKVFNRWGDLVFESDAGYTESWDGTYNGTDSPSATYYYVIDLGGEEEGFMGNVNIIR